MDVDYDCLRFEIEGAFTTRLPGVEKFELEICEVTNEMVVGQARFSCFMPPSYMSDEEDVEVWFSEAIRFNRKTKQFED